MACFRLGMCIPQPHEHTNIRHKSNNLFYDYCYIYVAILLFVNKSSQFET